ncbi:unnamed protein product [Polarella glacialis]|uniref:Uncharacterized protein n=1 Tax=Polarella glacialis TaxID=89957 RepID=A0A813GHK3_POLGL|nr:unnamed protein product [Polarella glacialis]
MDDAIRCAIVMSRALPRARDRQRFLPQEMLQNYATLRNAIRLQELRGRSYDQIGHPARATAAVSQYWPDGGSGDGYGDDAEPMDVSFMAQSSGRKVGRAGPKGKGKGQGKGKGKSDTAPAPARPAPSTSSTRVPTATSMTSTRVPTATSTTSTRGPTTSSTSSTRAWGMPQVRQIRPQSRGVPRSRAETQSP